MYIYVYVDIILNFYIMLIDSIYIKLLNLNPIIFFLKMY